MEVWKPVAEFKGAYKISNLGRLKRIKSGVHARPGYILKPQTNPNGYLYYPITINSKTRNRSVHRLIANAFIKKIPKGLEINHKNGIRNDNRIENLEIVTHSQNILHSTRILKKQIGEKNNLAKLKDKEIPDIRNLISQGKSLNTIAKKYGVSKRCISFIKKRKTWTHI